MADTPEVAHAKAAHFAEVAAAKSRARRSAALVQTPASTAPLVHAPVVAAPAPVISYAAPAVVPAVASYAAPAVVPAPAVYSYAAPAVVPAPSVYSYAAPAVRHATLTTIVNNPGHAVSYRVD